MCIQRRSAAQAFAQSSEREEAALSARVQWRVAALTDAVPWLRNTKSAADGSEAVNWNMARSELVVAPLGR